MKEVIKIEKSEQPLEFVLDEKGLKDIDKKISEIQKDLAKCNKVIEKYSTEYLQLLYTKSDDKKAEGIKAIIDPAMYEKTIIESDIRSLIIFKDSFKKKLANKSKALEEEKNKKIEAEIINKFIAELPLISESLAQIYLDEKKKDKSITASKFVAKIKRLIKDDKNEGGN